MSDAAKTPEPPYYVVLFTSRRTGGDNGYGETANRMEELARTIPGFLGIESAREPGGLGITVSYWASEEAIATWSAHAEHRVAKSTGKQKWYEEFVIRHGVVHKQKEWLKG